VQAAATVNGRVMIEMFSTVNTSCLLSSPTSISNPGAAK
jgi:hypothetical protein